MVEDFFELIPKAHAHELCDSAPKILFARLKAGGPNLAGTDVLLTARSVSAKNSNEFAVLTKDSSGRLHTDIDIDETIRAILSERFREPMRLPASLRLPFNYSNLPITLVSAARRMSRAFAETSPRIDFPAGHPADPIGWLIRLRHKISGDAGHRNFWPDGARAAITISYDADNSWIFSNDDLLRAFLDLEDEFGLKSAWYCVPSKSANPIATRGMEFLASRNRELGCHGFNHDGKLPFVDDRELERRLAEISTFSRTWDMQGFRSEWLLRNDRLFSALSRSFKYDSSIPTRSAFHTRSTANGCGTVMPFRLNHALIEVPITLPMDDDAFFYRKSLDEFWQEQLSLAAKIAEAGGLIHVTLHPQPHQSGRHTVLPHLQKFFSALFERYPLWSTTPAMIASHARSAPASLNAAVVL